jgi:hypothetical protein
VGCVPAGPSALRQGAHVGNGRHVVEPPRTSRVGTGSPREKRPPRHVEPLRTFCIEAGRSRGNRPPRHVEPLRTFCIEAGRSRGKQPPRHVEPPWTSRVGAGSPREKRPPRHVEPPWTSRVGAGPPRHVEPLREDRLVRRPPRHAGRFPAWWATRRTRSVRMRTTSARSPRVGWFPGPESGYGGTSNTRGVSLSRARRPI